MAQLHVTVRVTEVWIDCASCGRVLGRWIPGETEPHELLGGDCRFCRRALIGRDGEWRFTVRPVSEVVR